MKFILAAIASNENDVETGRTVAICFFQV